MYLSCHAPVPETRRDICDAVGYLGASVLNLTWEAVCTGLIGQNNQALIILIPISNAGIYDCRCFRARHNSTQGMRQGVTQRMDQRVHNETKEAHNISRASTLAVRSNGHADTATEIRESPTYYYAEP